MVGVCFPYDQLLPTCSVTHAHIDPKKSKPADREQASHNINAGRRRRDRLVLGLSSIPYPGRKRDGRQ